MSLIDYRDFVYGTLFLDKDNPIEEWKKLSVKQEKVAEYLNKKSELRFVGEDTDLTL